MRERLERGERGEERGREPGEREEERQSPMRERKRYIYI
jgi:hypothetical protein